VNALRRPAATRSLLLLATLALLLQFIGSLGAIRQVKDRFDFSSAICLTAGSATPAAAAAAASSLPAKDHGHADCKLCCSAGLPALVIDLPRLALAGAAPVTPAARLAAAPPPSPRWALQAARAPPLLS
jgi:hypothetical protein